MKFVILTLIIILGYSAASADNLFVEAGPGILKSKDSLVLLLRYQKETSELFGHSSFYEAFGAHWTDGSRATAYGLARGIVWNRKDRPAFFSTSFGLAGVSRTTSHMGTRFQFYFRFAYDWRLGSVPVSLGYIHFSNGKLVFGWDGPNSGENFLTFSAALF